MMFSGSMSINSCVCPCSYMRVVSRDTAGQERYQTITKQYYRRAQVTDPKSSFDDSAAGDTLVKTEHNIDATHAHIVQNIIKLHLDLQIT